MVEVQLLIYFPRESRHRPTSKTWVTFVNYWVKALSSTFRNLIKPIRNGAVFKALVALSFQTVIPISSFSLVSLKFGNI